MRDEREGEERGSGPVVHGSKGSWLRAQGSGLRALRLDTKHKTSSRLMLGSACALVLVLMLMVNLMGSAKAVQTLRQGMRLCTSRAITNHERHSIQLSIPDVDGQKREMNILDIPSQISAPPTVVLLGTAQTGSNAHIAYLLPLLFSAQSHGL